MIMNVIDLFSSSPGTFKFLKLSHCIPCHVVPHHLISCNLILCYVISSHAMSSDLILSHAIPSHPVQYNTIPSYTNKLHLLSSSAYPKLQTEFSYNSVSSDSFEFLGNKDIL